MRKKKSYMNNNNILSEGFFTKLFNLFKIKDKNVMKKIQNDRKVKVSLKKLNSGKEDLENLLNGYLKNAGIDKRVELNRYSLKDFF